MSHSSFDARPAGRDRSARRPAPGFAEVRSAALSRWPEILAALGIPSDALDGHHGPCPGCGGRDRFRFDDKDGRGGWICGGGGDLQAGDGFALLEHVYGYGPSEALRAVAGYLGLEGAPASNRDSKYARAHCLPPSRQYEEVLAHELMVLAMSANDRKAGKIGAEEDERERQARRRVSVIWKRRFGDAA